MVTDEFLLSKYAGSRDAGAFRELVRRYAGLVYGTSLRILNNADDAADVAQECFVELARNAGVVRSSLPGWLHRVARSRSLNAIRDESTRRRYEAQAASEEGSQSEPLWKDIALCLDEAVDGLTDDLRSPIILHYFRGLSQSEVAEELGLSQPTVSRRLDKGLDELREQLKKAGIVAPSAILAALIVSNRTSAAPSALTAELNGIPVASAGASTGAGIAGALAGLLGTLTGKVVAVLVAASIVGGLAVSSYVKHRNEIVVNRRDLSGAASTSEPDLPQELSQSVLDLDYEVRGFGELLALRACLFQAGVETSWSDILGYSGDAFGCDGMCYYSVRGHDVLTQAARSYGFEGRWRLGNEGTREDLRASLAKNQACIVVGSEPAGSGFRCLWWSVILGARFDQNELLIAGLGASPRWLTAGTRDSRTPVWVGQCPWAAGAWRASDGAPLNWQYSPRFLLGDRTILQPSEARLRDALRLAIACHGREKFVYCLESEGGETAPIGRGYLKKWPSLLREWSAEAKRETLNVGDPDPPSCYKDAYFAAVSHGMRRRAAAAFLQTHLSEMPERSRHALRSAAKHYERSAAAADGMFESLCSAECVRGVNWYRRLLAGPDYLGSQDEAGYALAATFASEHPDRWTARQAVLRSMNECLRDSTRIDKACRAAELILREDDAAIADIEKALASD